MKGCKYCITPHQDILTFTVGEDKDGYKITGHIDCDGQGLRYFDDLYEGGMCERAKKQYLEYYLDVEDDIFVDIDWLFELIEQYKKDQGEIE